MKKLLISSLTFGAVFFIFSMGCEPDEPYPPPNIDHNFGEMTDLRDGQKYQTIEIGNQTWVAQNLNFETGNSWCYNDDINNCTTYGRLYDVNTAKETCPEGWHLPSLAEWTQLIDFFGGPLEAGYKLKNSSGWLNNGNGSNESGFSGLPGGFRGIEGSFSAITWSGYWWSSTPFGNSGRVWARAMNCMNSNSMASYHNGAYGFSVRCVKD